MDELQPRVVPEARSGSTGSEKYDVSGVRTVGPRMLANRSTVTATSGRRRAKPRTYPSTSTASLAKPAARQRLGLEVLGEHRRVARRRAVDAVDDFTTSLRTLGRLLAGTEQLHGADDVGLLDRRPAAGAERGGDHGHVHDGVDLGLRDDLADDRVADVGPHELGVTEVGLGRHHVHADHPGDVRVGLQQLGEPATEVSGDPVTMTTRPTHAP